MLEESDKYSGYSTTYKLSDFCKRGIEESRLTNKWTQIIKSDNFNSLNSRDVLTKLVFQGIPNEIRGSVWYKYSCLNVDLSFMENEYDHLHERATEEAIDIIDRDSNRTFGSSIGNQRASTFINILVKILRSYAGIDPEIGYTQGMNFVASFPLVLTKDEHKSFCIFYGIMNNPLIYLRNFYIDGFPGFFELANAWKFFLEKKHPWLYQKLFQYSSVNIIALVAKCFQSVILAFDIPLEIKLCMIDRLILFGKVSLISFHLALIRIFLNELKSMPGFQCQQFFLQIDKNEIFKDVPFIIKTWNEEWITNEEFQESLKIINSQD